MNELETVIERLLETTKERYGPAAVERLELALAPTSPLAPRDPWQKDAGFVFPGIPQTGWHDAGDLPIVERLELSWEVILSEMRGVVSSRQGFQNYVAMGGDQSVIPSEWKAFYFKQGPRDCSANLQRCPRTAQLVTSSPRVADNVFFSALNAGGAIAPHAAEWNCLLNVHLGLVVPDGCEIRVGSETRKWTQGKCLTFDASFEHEVRNRSDSTRFVLFLDVWHPDLTDVEIECLEAFREAARGNGLKRQAETGSAHRNELDGQVWWREYSNPSADSVPR
jgi:aspartate beta-hydroxylase